MRLLAKRLNAKIYFPIGTEWFDRGFWWIAKPYNDNQGTINQYLRIDHRYSLKDNHYETDDLAHGDTLRSITFPQFLDMDIDILIASIPSHWKVYMDLRNKYKPKAKVVCQMGNMFNEVYDMIQDGQVVNLLASTLPLKLPKTINTVYYHQEMKVVDFESPKRSKKIYSFVNTFSDEFDLFKKGYKDFLGMEMELSDFNFKSYGASCRDGWVNGIDNQYKKMQEADFGYHVKKNGDGFGHVWHSWFMVGRPVITNYSDYRDKLGGLLFEHGVTGINLERGTVEENCELIKKLDVEKMSLNARKRFEEVVNYDREFEDIKKFIERLN